MYADPLWERAYSRYCGLKFNDDIDCQIDIASKLPH